MSFFGLVWTLVQGGAIYVDSIRHNIKDNECREKYQVKNTGTYIDSRGQDRDLITNKVVYSTELPNGDIVFKDKHGNITSNVSENIRNANKEESIFKGKTTYKCGEDFHDMTKKCCGEYFKDLYNNKVYVIRKVKDLCFYMDSESGLLIRLTDSESKIQKLLKENNCNYKSNSEIDNIISEFNNIQNEIRGCESKYSFFHNYEIGYEYTDDMIERIVNKSIYYKNKFGGK